MSLRPVQVFRGEPDVVDLYTKFACDLSQWLPVTWSPPHHLADGLTLPGIDTNALDTERIWALVVYRTGAADDVLRRLAQLRDAVQHDDDVDDRY
ncbi:hypothetical protein ACFXG4_32790 [Nocardia sp. NPDC059246]|uniref:hypothetical protein n=1 Tax=unclassified Nocardia TaxID=2637762 RepID=UPI00367F63AB